MSFLIGSFAFLMIPLMAYLMYKGKYVPVGAVAALGIVAEITLLRRHDIPSSMWFNIPFILYLATVIAAAIAAYYGSKVVNWSDDDDTDNIFAIVGGIVTLVLFVCAFGTTVYTTNTYPLLPKFVAATSTPLTFKDRVWKLNSWIFWISLVGAISSIRWSFTQKFRTWLIIVAIITGIAGLIHFFGNINPADAGASLAATPPIPAEAPIIEVPAAAVEPAPSEESAIVAEPAPEEAPVEAPADIDYGVTCWPVDVNTTFAATGGMGYREFLAAQYKGDGKFYHLPYTTLKAITTEVPGWFVFEGRPDESNGLDHTYVYSLDVNRGGDFVFQEGTFHFFKWALNGCPDANAITVGIDRLMKQKWDTRLSGNELAGLEGFKETAMLVEDGNVLGTFDKDNPYVQFTKYNLDGTNTCNELTQPRRVEYFGEQRGEYKNYSFGAPNCRSVAVGVFKPDEVFLKEGFQARFYNGAMDNQMAKTGEGLANYLFPTDWSGQKIAEWVLANLGVTVEDFQDPEGVTK